MKRLLLILTTTLVLTFAQGQNDSCRLYQASKGNYVVYHVELCKTSGTVFRLDYWVDKGGAGYLINFIDSLIKQSDTSKYLFVGQKTKIQNENNNKCLLCFNDYKDRQKSIEMTLTSDLQEAYRKINNGFWWNDFFKLCDSVDSKFVWQHYSFRNGFGLWNSFTNKEEYYIDFRLFVKKKTKDIKDSISKYHTAYTLTTTNILNSISTIEYSALKDSLVKLPAEWPYLSSYFSNVIKSICINRPELFFILADDMPDNKNLILGLADRDKETIKRLKAIQTDSPSKKEFFKDRRDITLMGIKEIVLYGSILGIIIYSILK